MVLTRVAAEDEAGPCLARRGHRRGVIVHTTGEPLGRAREGHDIAILDRFREREPEELAACEAVEAHD